MMLTMDTCLVRSYWTRCTRDAKPGPQARFKENLELFFEAVYQQARDRDTKLIPDLDSYITVSVCEAIGIGERGRMLITIFRPVLFRSCPLTHRSGEIRAGASRCLT